MFIDESIEREIKKELTDLIAPIYNELHWRIKLRANVHFWLKGGRGGARSSVASLEIIQGMIRDPEASAVVIRRVKDTLRGSVFEQMKWAIYKLGLEDQFHVPDQKLEITLKATGQKIFFRGADDPTKIKSIKVAKGFLKYVWYEESNQHGDLQDIRNINQSILRGESDYFIALYTFNPPRDPNHWINLEMKAPRSDYFILHATYLDVPAKWNGPVFWNDSAELKRRDFASYEHELLGIPNGKGYDTVIDYDLLQYALASFQDEHQINLLMNAERRLQLGVDVARKGDDKSVTYINHHNIIELGFEMLKNKTTELTGRTLNLVRLLEKRYKRYEIDIYVDETGVGGGVVDELEDNIHKIECAKIVGINNGASPVSPRGKERYFNLGAEMWFKFKEQLEINEQCIKKDKVATIRIVDYDLTTAQLTDRKYEVTAKGQLRLESKENMKKRGSKSPDHADALILCAVDLNASGFAYYVDYDDEEDRTLLISTDKDLLISNW